MMSAMVMGGQAWLLEISNGSQVQSGGWCMETPGALHRRRVSWPQAGGMDEAEVTEVLEEESFFRAVHLFRR